MADNSKSSFGLGKLRDGIDEKTDELSKDANARSISGSDVRRDKPFTFEQEDYDRTEAPKDDMRRYWRQFETTPIVRKPITSFASRVTEPGYYIEAEELEREEVAELGEWLDQCAIVEGQPGKDFRLLAKKAIIQREVRGTALVEKAPHERDPEKVAGLKLLNPEPVEAVTRPNQSILMAPDDLAEFDDAPEAESGGAAAWLQDTLETDQTFFGRTYNEDSDTKIGFRRDEIIPLTRDADVGEVYGTSRLEAVSDRIEGIKNKLHDNDEAISSKAYPLWLFMFGDPDSEEGVWDSDDISDFMSAHEMENFRPGMKQGVRGDVSVDTISGEVAEIAEYLQFDIQWIMASMPMPLFLLGSFNTGASVGQVAGVAQQQDVIRQISEARRELEEEFTPLLREVAEQKGIDPDRARDIKLRFGKPGQPDPEVARSQQVIRYISDADGGDTQAPGQGQQQPRQGQQPSAQPQTGSPRQRGQGGSGNGEQPDGVITKGETPSSVENPAPDQKIAGVDEDGNPYSDMVTGERETQQVDSRYAQVWNEQSTAHLEQVVDADNESVEQMSGLIHELFLTLRDRTLETVEEKYEATPKFAATEYENIANKNLNALMRESGLKREAQSLIEDELARIEQAYGKSGVGFGQRDNVKFFSQNVRNAVRDAGEELLRRSRKLVRDGVVSGESWGDVRQRVETVYDEESLSQRANIIAHMELHNAVETMKLQQFREHEDIVGVRAHNPDASTELTRQLHGAEALFERSEIDNQLAHAVEEDVLPEGFAPLPRTPPYHFNDTTTLRPVYENEVST
jgi:hypothetical protein